MVTDPEIYVGLKFTLIEEGLVVSAENFHEFLAALGEERGRITLATIFADLSMAVANGANLNVPPASLH